MMADHLAYYESEELFREVLVKLRGASQFSEPRDLARFPLGISSRQAVFSLQHADALSATKTFGHHVDDCSVDIIDAVAQGLQFRRDA